MISRYYRVLRAAVSMSLCALHALRGSGKGKIPWKGGRGYERRTSETTNDYAAGSQVPVATIYVEINAQGSGFGHKKSVLCS